MIYIICVRYTHTHTHKHTHTHIYIYIYILIIPLSIFCLIVVFVLSLFCEHDRLTFIVAWYNFVVFPLSLVCADSFISMLITTSVYDKRVFVIADPIGLFTWALGCTDDSWGTNVFEAIRIKQLVYNRCVIYLYLYVQLDICSIDSCKITKRI